MKEVAVRGSVMAKEEVLRKVLNAKRDGEVVLWWGRWREEGGGWGRGCGGKIKKERGGGGRWSRWPFQRGMAYLFRKHRAPDRKIWVITARI